jgi:hypothetical protein
MTVYGTSFKAGEAGVVANGLPTGSDGVKATGSFAAVYATGTTVGVLGEAEVGMLALGQDYGLCGAGFKAAIDIEGGMIGIKAYAKSGPAGEFRREFDIQEGAHPQLHIKPQPMWVPNPVPAQGHEIIPPDNPDVLLPVNAQAGDLLLTSQTVKPRAADSPPNAEATLWLCVVGSGKEPAVWKQVLLGPSIVGRNQGKG